MTPADLEIILHYHTRCDDALCVRDGDVDDMLGKLVLDGLLERCEAGASRRFKPTSKLDAYVAMLLDTPLPEQRWVDPRSGKTIL